MPLATEMERWGAGWRRGNAFFTRLQTPVRYMNALYAPWIK
jgi:hypothetical protein